MTPSSTQSGNIWYHWPGPGCASDHRVSPGRFSHERPYDVAIIGAGVIGCALAYVLSQYRLRIVMVDRAFDVGEGTSKANSAIIHTGFDASPGSLESHLVTDASRQWPALAEKLKIPFKHVSALMLAMNEKQLAQLPSIREKAFENGVRDVQLVSAERTRRLEPNVAPAVLGSLLVPRESIVDPFTTSVAYAEVAVQNGVDIVFGLDVSGIDNPSSKIKSVVGPDGIVIPSRLVINASGLGSRKLVDNYHGEPMDLNPRRGQFVVFDRGCSHLIRRILLPIPTKQTKGMLVCPTIFGNLLAGPTAEDLGPEDIRATNTTAAGLAAVRKNSAEMCPALSQQQVIAAYAGLRCNCAQGSYWVRFNDGHRGIVTLAGIRSTGLTSSISTAQYVARHMHQQCGLELQANASATDSRADSQWPGWWRPPWNNSRQIGDNPDYGRIVCSCENISRGEVQDAIQACHGVATLDSLKRRTRVLTGRCQGFNCCVPVAQMISNHFQIPLAGVTKRGPGTEFIVQGPSVADLPATRSHIEQGPYQSLYNVIVIGAGPAGIGAAVELSRAGVASVLLVDRAAEVGGVPAKYEVKRGGVPTFLDWSRGKILFGRQYVERLKRLLDRTAAEVQLECQVVGVNRTSNSVTLVSPALCKAEVAAQAVVFTCGAREKTRTERGWIVGRRPARELYTMQLLQLLDGCHVLPLQHPAIIGSDLIAYSAAAKLSAAGSAETTLFDRSDRPQAGLLQRRYFAKWSRPTWHASKSVAITGDQSATAVIHAVAQGLARSHPCDGVVISGELVPNSELLAAAGLETAGRTPICPAKNVLSHPGWFIAGGALGGFRGADWCYRDGRRAGAKAAAYLQKVLRS